LTNKYKVIFVFLHLLILINFLKIILLEVKLKQIVFIGQFPSTNKNSMGQGESTVQFRLRIDQLLENQIAVNDHLFWRDFFTSNVTIDDIFSLIQPEDVRQIRKKQPGNLGLIIFKVLKSKNSPPRVLNNFSYFQLYKKKLLNTPVL
jgi:hypothetical protein